MSKPLHSQAAYNEIDAKAETIRAALLKKAIKGQATQLQQGIRYLESKDARGNIGEEWMTNNITQFCRWGTRTPARNLAWDLYHAHRKLWQMMADNSR